MIIVDSEKIQIRQLIQTPQWKTIERIADILCTKIQETSKLRETEWETISTTLIEEGEIRGIRRFIQELYNQVGQI